MDDDDSYKWDDNDGCYDGDNKKKRGKIILAGTHAHTRTLHRHIGRVRERKRE